MGLMIDGVWHDRGLDTRKTGGRFVRSESHFRNWVTVDGAAGPSGKGGFEAAPGRYHLYVSLACPWAHRTLIFRKLKRLERVVGVSVVHWHLAEQ
ncbi:MAG: glutathione S-transferase family protein, partial [Kiloniellaceae bacterium]